MLHEGHRERLRERFLESPDSFADHELIEFLLCFSIPRRNTNDISHELFNKFGSIKGILNANMEALITTEGIGETSAIFFRAIAELLSRYEKEKHYTKTPLGSPRALVDYLRSLFVGTSNEITYMLGFDSSQNLVLSKKVAEGYSCGNVMSIRDMTLTAISSNVAGIILAHNHPNGKAIPSGEDITTTNALKRSFNLHGIDFIEHFIITDTQCYPILNANNAALYNID